MSNTEMAISSAGSSSSYASSSGAGIYDPKSQKRIKVGLGFLLTLETQGCLGFRLFVSTGNDDWANCRGYQQ